MTCRHCGGELALSRILCDTCAYKAMQVLPTDPKERIQIYRILRESDNPIIVMCVDQLIALDQDELADIMLDPNDRMFNPREA